MKAKNKFRLSPCPFCGGKETGILTTSYDGQWFAVFCEGCMTQTRKCRREEDAIEAWELRAEDAVQIYAEWLVPDENYPDTCSNCKFEFVYEDEEYLPKFCPECGARMTGKRLLYK